MGDEGDEMIVLCNPPTLWGMNINLKIIMFLLETNLPTPIWQGRDVVVIAMFEAKEIYKWIAIFTRTVHMVLYDDDL